MPPQEPTLDHDGTEGRSAAAGSAAPGGGTVLEPFLRVPLFWKLTIANAAVAVLVCLAGLFLGRRVAPQVGTASLVGLVGGALLVAVATGMLLNGALVRLALSPLRRLEATARKVGRGDLDARAGESVLADPDLAELMARFDDMLDTLKRVRDRQRRMASSVVESEERTRRRIARRLYDDVAQQLASMIIQVPMAWRAGEESDPEAVLERIRGELADALEAVRAAARRLLPPELDELGLPAAVRAEARVFQDQTGITVDVDAPPEVPQPMREGSLALFRIMQEALSAAGQAKEGGCVRVALEGGNGHLDCVVRREGARFAEEMRVARGSIARLDELKQRAGYVGGTVTVRESDAGESVVRIRIPLSPMESATMTGVAAGRAGSDGAALPDDISNE